MSVARIRSIKPAFWASEALATRLPGPDGRQARLLFIGLWGLAEDLTGVLRGHPSRIRSDLFAYDEDVAASDVDRWLGLLEAGRFIVRYEREGSRYVWIRGFAEHQKIDKPSKSTLPEPSGLEKEGRSEGSPSPRRALAEPSAPEVVSRKGGGGGEETEEDDPATQEPAGADSAPAGFRLEQQEAPTPGKRPRKERTPSEAEDLFRLLQRQREERCSEVGEAFVPERWDFARQNKALSPLLKGPEEDRTLFEGGWFAYLAEDGERVRTPAWSLAWFMAPGVRAKYETKAAREAA